MRKSETSIISWGDAIDVFHKVRLKGVGFLTSLLFKGRSGRVAHKWDSYASVSDFWIIPGLRKYWNLKISGDEQQIYEAYTWQKYLKNKTALQLLSVGCGDGGHERNFAQYDNFSSLTGIDVSPGSIAKATKLAAGNDKLQYRCADFFSIDFAQQKFDVVLFNASLHHFSDIDALLGSHIDALLAEDGIVVVYEYCGPNRLQWRKSQLKKANELLAQVPVKYRLRAGGSLVKRKVYRPGLLRMLLNDPSEAPDSENLTAALHRHFEVLEETRLGWNILHILLKDIAHNFVSDDTQTKKLLTDLIAAEEEFCSATGENDAIFGVYRKKARLLESRIAESDTHQK